jgi:hypothetical protein
MPQTVIEICPKPDGSIPEELIRKAYLASQSMAIVLILRDISPKVVDPTLDDLVPHLPLNIPGVKYVRVQDQAEVSRALVNADQIYCSSLENMGLNTFQLDSTIPIQSIAEAYSVLDNFVTLAQVNKNSHPTV